jgi:hypothetical protein
VTDESNGRFSQPTRTPEDAKNRYLPELLKMQKILPELLKIQKIGQFPDELVKIEVAQIHCVHCLDLETKGFRQYAGRKGKSL